MPLIVVCGIPGSGKTTRAKQIRNYLVEKHKCQVVLINEESLGISKQQGYADAQEEKVTRGRIKFEVQKNLLGGVIVIADSLNYIKGYRYQMNCIAREQKCTYCVIFCNTSLEKALQYNRLNDNRFSDEMVEELAKRMQTPHLKSRWDIPLFERRDDQHTPLEEIAQTLLFQSKKTKDPISTKQQEKLSQDYLYQVDKLCQEVCEQACLGKLKLKNNWSALEVRKIKNGFTGVIREKPMPLKAIRQSFLQYLIESDKRR